MLRTKTLRIILAITLIVKAFDVIAIDTIKDKAMEDAAAKVANIDIDPEMMDQATEMVETINSDEWQTILSEMKKGAALPLGIDVDNEASSQTLAHSYKDRVYVFISASIPINTLRNYARDLSKIPGGVMILRGFVAGGHQMKPTAQLVADILKQDTACEGASCPMFKVEIQIDPLLFRKYQIKRVPSVAFEENALIDGYCGMSKDEVKAIDDQLIVVGDAALSYAMETLYRANKNEKIASLITLLNGEG